MSYNSVYENFLAHVGHLSSMNFTFMQDNCTNNITFIEQGELVGVSSFLVLLLFMIVTEKCPYGSLVLIVAF